MTNPVSTVSTVRPLTYIALVVIALAAVTAVLAGCGGSETKTVSVAGSPSGSGTATTQPGTSTAKTAPATTTGADTTTTGTAPSQTTSTPSATRTATAPAFTETEKPAGGTSGEGLAAALAVVRAQGYAVKDTSDYHANQTLRVLIGTDPAGSGQQAFFFVDGRYIGTDTKQPSAQVHVVSQGDTEVTLAYALAGGGQATVPFQLNNGQLAPLAPIPSASSRQ
jgi:LppP/LprE lipoprotein